MSLPSAGTFEHQFAPEQEGKNPPQSVSVSQRPACRTHRWLAHSFHAGHPDASAHRPGARTQTWVPSQTCQVSQSDRRVHRPGAAVQSRVAVEQLSHAVHSAFVSHPTQTPLVQ
jgi:hypothetical protein